MTKVMFSIHVGDSIAHILRTRSVARYLIERGYKVLYVVPSKAMPYLKDYVSNEFVQFNDQSYSYSQMPFQGQITEKYFYHAVIESRIFQTFQPDVLIGDTGIITYTYNQSVPILKILNRFYIELLGQGESPFLPQELNLIRSQVETLINHTRKKLGMYDVFEYKDFASPPALINGASYFVNDIPFDYDFVGVYNSLKVQFKPPQNYENCFLTFGTGLSENRLPLVSTILKGIERRFRKIYISYGTKVKQSDLYNPGNAIMKPIFSTMPEDIGLIISHGGWGTLHLGAQSGIPMIAIPFQVEHYSNSWKMEKQGLGINVGSYSKENFQGLFEDMQLDWPRFEEALDNVSNIRKVEYLRDSYKTDKYLLSKSVEKFIKSKIR